MGTDIHLAVEVLGLDGKWHWEPDALYMGGPDPTCRSYNTFAFLAGVRNGHGFAGVYRHEPITPVCPDRGLPGDRDRRLDDYDDYDYGIGDHSFTWATLQELLDAPWDMEFQAGGCILSSQAVTWEAGTRPGYWFGGWNLRTMEFNEWCGAGCPVAEDLAVQVRWTDQPLVDCPFRKWLFLLRDKVREAESLMPRGWLWQEYESRHVIDDAQRVALDAMKDRGEPPPLFNVRILMGFDS